MRRWFVLVLIALLPLRGWVGEAMAGEMLAQHLAAPKIVASGQASMGADGHQDCMGHALPSDAGHPAASPQPGSDCPTCAQCQACSSVALALPPALSLPPVAPSVVPGEAPAHFASAEAARGLKPPIS